MGLREGDIESIERNHRATKPKPGEVRQIVDRDGSKVYYKVNKGRITITEKEGGSHGRK